jgi:hypothetical protein
MTICEGGAAGSFGTTASFSGLILYDVSLDNERRELRPLGAMRSAHACASFCSDPIAPRPPGKNPAPSAPTHQRDHLGGGEHGAA